MKYKFQIVIEAESIEELEAVANSLPESAAITQAPVKFNLPTTDKSPVLSVGKQWNQVPGTNQYSGTTVEADSTGLPWDARIHVDSKTKTKNGQWINRRNLDANLKVAVETELRQGMQIPQVAPVVKPVPFSHSEATVAPAAPSIDAMLTQQAPQVVAPVVAPPPPRPVVPTLPTAAPVAPPAPPKEIGTVHDFVSFKKNLDQIMALLVGKAIITHEYIKSLTNYFEVKALVDVAASEEKSEILFNTLVEQGFIQVPAV